MDRLKIIGCGYRRWALEIFETVGHTVDMAIIKKPEDIEYDAIKAVNPNLILFYGWSWPVPADIVDNFTCLCLTPSPLPKYRGGSPIQNQIMNGEVESAVSIYKMTKEAGVGDLCCQMPFSLDGELWDILKCIRDIGSFETLKLLKDHQNGGIKYWPQAGEPTVYKKRTPEESEIIEDELKLATARYLYNKIRCLQYPYPNTFITCADGKRLYLTEAHCEE